MPETVVNGQETIDLIASDIKGYTSLEKLSEAISKNISGFLEIAGNDLQVIHEFFKGLEKVESLSKILADSARITDFGIGQYLHGIFEAVKNDKILRVAKLSLIYHFGDKGFEKYIEIEKNWQSRDEASTNFASHLVANEHPDNKIPGTGEGPLLVNTSTMSSPPVQEKKRMQDRNVIIDQCLLSKHGGREVGFASFFDKKEVARLQNEFHTNARRGRVIPVSRQSDKEVYLQEFQEKLKQYYQGFPLEGVEGAELIVPREIMTYFYEEINDVIPANQGLFDMIGNAEFAESFLKVILWYVGHSDTVKAGHRFAGDVQFQEFSDFIDLSQNALFKDPNADKTLRDNRVLDLEEKSYLIRSLRRIFTQLITPDNRYNQTDSDEERKGNEYLSIQNMQLSDTGKVKMVEQVMHSLYSRDNTPICENDILFCFVSQEEKQITIIIKQIIQGGWWFEDDGYYPEQGEYLLASNDETEETTHANVDALTDRPLSLRDKIVAKTPTMPWNQEKVDAFPIDLMIHTYSNQPFWKLYEELGLENKLTKSMKRKTVSIRSKLIPVIQGLQDADEGIPKPLEKIMDSMQRYGLEQFWSIKGWLIELADTEIDEQVLASITKIVTTLEKDLMVKLYQGIEQTMLSGSSHLEDLYLDKIYQAWGIPATDRTLKILRQEARKKITKMDGDTLFTLYQKYFDAKINNSSTSEPLESISMNLHGIQQDLSTVVFHDRFNGFVELNLGLMNLGRCTDTGEIVVDDNTDLILRQVLNNAYDPQQSTTYGSGKLNTLQKQADNTLTSLGLGSPFANKQRKYTVEKLSNSRDHELIGDWTGVYHEGSRYVRITNTGNAIRVEYTPNLLGTTDTNNIVSTHSGGTKTINFKKSAENISEDYLFATIQEQVEDPQEAVFLGLVVFNKMMESMYASIGELYGVYEGKPLVWKVGMDGLRCIRGNEETFNVSDMMKQIQAGDIPPSYLWAKLLTAYRMYKAAVSSRYKDIKYIKSGGYDQYLDFHQSDEYWPITTAKLGENNIADLLIYQPYAQEGQQHTTQKYDVVLEKHSTDPSPWGYTLLERRADGSEVRCYKGRIIVIQPADQRSLPKGVSVPAGYRIVGKVDQGIDHPNYDSYATLLKDYSMKEFTQKNPEWTEKIIISYLSSQVTQDAGRRLAISDGADTLYVPSLVTDASGVQQLQWDFISSTQGSVDLQQFIAKLDSDLTVAGHDMDSKGIPMPYEQKQYQKRLKNMGKKIIQGKSSVGGLYFDRYSAPIGATKDRYDISEPPLTVPVSSYNPLRDPHICVDALRTINHAVLYG